MINIKVSNSIDERFCGAHSEIAKGKKSISNFTN